MLALSVLFSLLPLLIQAAPVPMPAAKVSHRLAAKFYNSQNDVLLVNNDPCWLEGQEDVIQDTLCVLGNDNLKKRLLGITENDNLLGGGGDGLLGLNDGLLGNGYERYPGEEFGDRLPTGDYTYSNTNIRPDNSLLDGLSLRSVPQNEKRSVGQRGTIKTHSETFVERGIVDDGLLGSDLLGDQGGPYDGGNVITDITTNVNLDDDNYGRPTLYTFTPTGIYPRQDDTTVDDDDSDQSDDSSDSDSDSDDDDNSFDFDSQDNFYGERRVKRLLGAGNDGLLGGDGGLLGGLLGGDGNGDLLGGLLGGDDLLGAGNLLGLGDGSGNVVANLAANVGISTGGHPNPANNGVLSNVIPGQENQILKRNVASSSNGNLLDLGNLLGDNDVVDELLEGNDGFNGYNGGRDDGILGGLL